jgi:hypothetical protein
MKDVGKLTRNGIAPPTEAREPKPLSSSCTLTLFRVTQQLHPDYNSLFRAHPL